jgi:hypothetical protein
MSGLYDVPPADKYQQWLDAVLSALEKYDEEYKEEVEKSQLSSSPPPAAAPAAASSSPPRDDTEGTGGEPTEPASDSTPPPEATTATNAEATPLPAQLTVTPRVSDDGELGAVSTLRTPAISNLPSCKIAQKYLRELVDASQSIKLAERLCAMVAPLVAAYQKRPLHVCAEPVLAMLVATFISNLAAHTTATADLIDGSHLVDFLLVLGQHHRRIKKVIVAVLSALSNVMHLDKVALPGDVAEVMIVLIAPLYSEATVVEVWSGAIANMVIRCPDSCQLFIQADTTATLQRLLMYFGDDPRILRSGLHCLTALSLPAIVQQRPSTTRTPPNQ